MNADADFARCVRCGIGVVVTTAESWRNSAKNLTWWTAAIGNGPASSRRVGQDQEHGRAYGGAATKRIGMADWPPRTKKVKTVLFLCTGNYYRSRFAEELFNHRAEHVGLDWIALSRALAIERGVNNVGPISPFALEGLKDRGLVAQAGDRFPRQCTVIDLESASEVVALDESEHRPLIGERFSVWESRVEYWQVADVEIVQPKVALSVVDRQIESLLGRLL